MEFDPQDQDIINLLTKLKDANGTYPEHMLVIRRRSFLKQMTEVGLGIGAATGITNVPAKPTPSGVSPLTTTVLETALIAAIVIETSAMAYFYRDQVAEFFQNNIATPSQTTPDSVISTTLEVEGVSPSPAVLPTITSVTPVQPVIGPITEPAVVIATPTETSLPGNTQEVNQLNVTPDPKDNNGNNGNHYGQTPKPERTKENNGNNDNNGGGNNDNGNNDNNGNDEDNNGNSDKDPKPTKDK